jgi:hypothetical protein
MWLLIRVGSGVLSLSSMALTFWCVWAEPSRREWSFAGGRFALNLDWAALWVAQFSYLFFALSRWTRAKLHRVEPSPRERFLFKGVKASALSVLGTAALWIAWGFLRT